MRLVALTRVSTRRQADDGYGLEVQEADVRAWGRKHRHRLVAVLSEQISGDAPLDDRAGLVEALAMVTDGRADGIVVPRLDRLARAMLVQEQLIAEAIRLGGVIRSCNPTEDAQLVGEANDPERKLVRQILGSIHEYERAMIKIRMRAGLDRKAAAGGYVGGPPPYGWIAVSGDLRPIPAEQAVRKAIKEWRRAGWSFRKIAERLNADRVPSKRGGPWHPQTVARVIKDTRRAVISPRKSDPREPAMESEREAV